VRRRRGDPQPTAPVGVLLASPGTPLSAGAVRRAAELAGGEPVAVLSIARIHGSAFGMPNPGLMPTRPEREAQRTIVATAIGGLERKGVRADGQVAVARNPARTIARIAGVRGVRHVVLDAPTGGRLRQFVEGDLAAAVRRRAGPGVEVHSVGAAGRPDRAAPAAATTRRRTRTAKGGSDHG